jgi:hypothetical protein
MMQIDTSGDGISYACHNIFVAALTLPPAWKTKALPMLFMLLPTISFVNEKRIMDRVHNKAV